MKLKLATILAVGFMTAGMSSPLRATTVVAPTFGELASQADTIFEGRVIATRSEWRTVGSESRIVTFVTFTVLEKLKGKAESPYVLQLEGGSIGDVHDIVDGVPQFEVGQENVLFVQNNGKQFCPLVGIMHGRYRVVTESEAGIATKTIRNNEDVPLESVEEVGRESNPETAGQHRGMTARAFKDRISRELGK